MTLDTKDLLNSIMDSFDRIGYIRSEDIPNIDLYMDQVTTFMDNKLKNTTRDPEHDKILTKTMINNYAKNRLLPPPVKKKYSREHILLLLFIYYYKNLLSFSDIEQLFGPITEKYFGSDSKLSLSHIYEEVFALENNQMERLKEDTLAKFNAAKSTFGDIDEEEREYLQLFAFISELSFDVYLKKQMIEILIDQLREETSETKNGKKKKEKTNG